MSERMFSSILRQDMKSLFTTSIHIVLEFSVQYGKKNTSKFTKYKERNQFSLFTGGTYVCVEYPNKCTKQLPELKLCI